MRSGLDGFAFLCEQIQFKGEIRLENFEGETTLGIQARQPPFPKMNSLFSRTLSLFCTELSLFCAEQGIVHDALESQQKLTSARDRRRQMAPRSKKFPVIFPV